MGISLNTVSSEPQQLFSSLVQLAHSLLLSISNVMLMSDGVSGSFT